MYDPQNLKTGQSAMVARGTRLLKGPSITSFTTLLPPINHLPDKRLSGHQCQGWLAAALLRGLESSHPFTRHFEQVLLIPVVRQAEQHGQVSRLIEPGRRFDDRPLVQQ